MVKAHAVAIYLDYAKFRARTTVPESFVDDVERQQAGWVELQLDQWSRWVDARLRKRYASPFNAHDDPDPTPVVIQMWLQQIVTWRLMVRRGIDPNDLQAETIKDDHDRVLAEILEAANSDEGWFDIPLRTAEDGSAMRTSNPKSYSEQSPYVYTDEQQLVGRLEDDAGRGTSG